MKCTKDIASEEFWLNVKAQNIKVKEPSYIGYEYDTGIYFVILIIPNKLLKDKK